MGLEALGGHMGNAVPNSELKPVEPLPAASMASEVDPLESMLWLPCTLSLDIPVVKFTIGDLLMLVKGSIVETACHHTSDVPLRVNQLLIGWTEFEVVGDRLAARITDQA
jgi:flagellar motor switch/type III secretory pathway protein FliN